MEQGKIYQNVAQLIGNTPLLELNRYRAEQKLKARILAKLEYFNPAGSVKDRVALAMIEDAEQQGILTKDSVIIEPTSGNTGIGLAAVAAARGYRVLITMPETMSEERRKLMKAYGAQLVLTPGALGMQGAIDKAQELAREIPGGFVAGQFTNMANPAAHKATTGPEILAGYPRGYRLFGGGRGNRRHPFRGRRVPKGAKTRSACGRRGTGRFPCALSGGGQAPILCRASAQGFVPQTLNTAVYDEIITVQGPDAFDASRRLAALEGVLTGISSGAALWAATQIALREESQGKTIVVVLPDTGERYLSTSLFPS